MRRLGILVREAGVPAVALGMACMVGVVAASRGTLALLLPLLLVVGLVLLFRPIIGLLLLAGTIPLEAATMVEGASAPRLIGLAVFGAWAVQKVLRGEPLKPLVSWGLVITALLLFSLACLSLIWAEYPQGLERRLWLLFQLIVLSVLVLDLTISWSRLAWVAKLLVFGCTVAALLTIEQYFGGGVRRAGGGVVGGINRTAVTLVLILPFAFYLLRSSEAVIWKWLGAIYIGLAGVAVAVTLSRMNMLLYPLVVGIHLLLMARTRGNRFQILVLAGAAVVAVSAVPFETIQQRALTITPYLTQTAGIQEDAEAHSPRGFHYRVGLAIFRDHPLLGSGYDNYGAHIYTYQWELSGAPRMWFGDRRRSPHGSHIGFLANLGIIGFMLWLGLFGFGFYYLWGSRRELRNPALPEALLLDALLVALGLQLVYGLYSDIHLSKIFWLILGLTVAAHRISLTTKGRTSAHI